MNQSSRNRATGLSKGIFSAPAWLPAEPDESILNRIRSGDQDALAEFIQRNRARLLGYIRQRMSPVLFQKVEPVDVLQETTISALNSFTKIDWANRDPYPWLCRLAARRIIDFHRHYFAVGKRTIAREVPLDHAVMAYGSGVAIDRIDAGSTTPSQVLYGDQILEIFSQAIQQLSDEQCEATRLRYIEGDTAKQIGERLGRSEGSVRVMLSRALSKARNALMQANALG